MRPPPENVGPGSRETTSGRPRGTRWTKFPIRPNLVVMDVEGFEDTLLRHANLKSVDKLLVEFHPQILGEKVVSDLRNV